MVSSNKIILCAIIFFSWGCGYVTHRVISAPAERVQIYYLSQDELVALEQERIKSIPLNHRQMFMGRGYDAVKIAIELSKTYEGPKAKLVLSEKPVSGVGVSSISAGVHQRLIGVLSGGEK